MKKKLNRPSGSLRSNAFPQLEEMNMMRQVQKTYISPLFRAVLVCQEQFAGALFRWHICQSGPHNPGVLLHGGLHGRSDHRFNPFSDGGRIDKPAEESTRQGKIMRIEAGPFRRLEERSKREWDGGKRVVLINAGPSVSASPRHSVGNGERPIRELDLAL